MAKSLFDPTRRVDSLFMDIEATVTDVVMLVAEKIDPDHSDLQSAIRRQATDHLLEEWRTKFSHVSSNRIAQCIDLIYRVEAEKEIKIVDGKELRDTPSKVFVSNLINELYDMHYSECSVAIGAGWDWSRNTHGLDFWDEICCELNKAAENRNELHPDRVDEIATALLSLNTTES